MALNSDLALVQSADFITPVVDRPFLFGQIAAANSLSDIYAMGATPISALNLVAWDSENIPKQTLAEILAGGASKIKEAGAALLGGHTIKDSELKYGLSVSGIAHPARFWRNNTAQIGDVLILTKPLGIGVLSTALKRGLLDNFLADKIANSMATLNKSAVQIALKYEISAATDITGFGFLGHLSEMLNPQIAFVIESSAVPIFSEAFSFAEQGIAPGGSWANKKTYEHLVKFDLCDNSAYKNSGEILLYDAQTSGGLLLAINAQSAEQALAQMLDCGLNAAIIGEVISADSLKSSANSKNTTPRILVK